MRARIEQDEEAFLPFFPLLFGRLRSEERERVLCCEASLGSLRNLWLKGVQKSTRIVSRAGVAPPISLLLVTLLH